MNAARTGITANKAMHAQLRWCVFTLNMVTRRNRVIAIRYPIDFSFRTSIMKPKELLTELHARLRAAIEKDYTKWTAKFDDVCGYAVCAPPYVESIFPSYQLASESLEDAAIYYPPEWGSFGTLGFDTEFDAFCKTLHDRRVLYGSNKKEGLSADSVFKTIFAVLKELDAEGLFGDKSSGRYITMWDVGNDEEWIIKASQKLNSRRVHAAAKLAMLGE